MEQIVAGFEVKPLETVAINFEAKPAKIVVTGFEAKPVKTVAACFEVKPLETVTTGFKVKPAKIVRVVLRSNHSQTVDIGFKAQLRNQRSSFPRARCRPHTVPPDLSIVRPPSTRPVRSFPVLCTNAPTPVMILVAVRRAAPTTCTP
jgi:hypothetical protein